MDSGESGSIVENEEDPPPRKSQGEYRSGIFYGWWIVAVSTLASTIQSAFFNIGAQALVLPIIREFETTRTAVSVAFSLRRLEGGLTGPLEGYLIHWMGPRPYMVTGWIIFGLGFIAIGLCQNIYQFYGAFLMVTLGQSVAGFLPIVTVLVNWFDKWRGRAIAIYQLGGSIGALLVPVFAWSILNLGWRETTIGVGFLVIVLGVPIALMMHAHPEDYGYLPDGAQPGEEIDNGNDAQDVYVNESILNALKSRNFWFLGFAHSAGITAWGALQVHQIPALVDIGIPELAAAGIVSYTLVISAFGRLAGGFLGDFLGTKKITAAAFIFQGIAVMILAFADTNAEVMIFATIFGIAFGTRGTLMTVLRAEVFGRQNFSRLAGLMDPVSSLSVLIAPIFAGIIFDTSGSYQFAFLVLAVVNALGALLLVGITVPNRQQQYTENPEVMDREINPS
ncbi:MAG: MFS transporter [Dehalococcoidia bacterium]|nr:MFS transporter [Dehalococcoidia bacterium]